VLCSDHNAQPIVNASAPQQLQSPAAPGGAQG